MHSNSTESQKVDIVGVQNLINVPLRAKEVIKQNLFGLVKLKILDHWFQHVFGTI